MSKPATKPAPQTAEAERVAKLEKKLFELQLDRLAERSGVNPKRKADFVQLLSNGHFGIDEDGDLTVLQNGQASYTDPLRYLDKLKTQKAHAWAFENEHGKPFKSEQTQTKDTAANTMKRADFDRLSPSQRMTLARQGVKLID